MRYFAYETRYKGPTNHLGGRIQTREVGTGRSRYSGYNHALSMEANRVEAVKTVHQKEYGADLDIFHVGCTNNGIYTIFGKSL